MSVASRSSLVVLTATLMVGGCAGPGSFPSLAPRPVEQLGFDEPVRTAPDVPGDAALRQRISALLVEARAGQQSYAALLAPAQQAVAKAGAAGGEPWVVAHQAIARLEAARRQTPTALASLDALAIERAASLTGEADKAALAEAVAFAAALAEQQRQTIDALLARLSPA